MITISCLRYTRQLEDRLTVTKKPLPSLSTILQYVGRVSAKNNHLPIMKNRPSAIIIFLQSIRTSSYGTHSHNTDNGNSTPGPTYKKYIFISISCYHLFLVFLSAILEFFLLFSTNSHTLLPPTSRDPFSLQPVPPSSNHVQSQHSLPCFGSHALCQQLCPDLGPVAPHSHKTWSVGIPRISEG